MCHCFLKPIYFGEINMLNFQTNFFQLTSDFNKPASLTYCAIIFNRVLQDKLNSCLAFIYESRERNNVNLENGFKPLKCAFKWQQCISALTQWNFEIVAVTVWQMPCISVPQISGCMEIYLHQNGVKVWSHRWQTRISKQRQTWIAMFPNICVKNCVWC